MKWVCRFWDKYEQMDNLTRLLTMLLIVFPGLFLLIHVGNKNRFLAIFGGLHLIFLIFTRQYSKIVRKKDVKNPFDESGIN